MQDLNAVIVETIETLVGQAPLETKYRRPRVGFANARHPLFQELKSVANPNHLLPTDLLPGARSVISFFVPFERELVRINQKSPLTAPEWAYAKRDTEGLIERIVGELRQRLAALGVQSSENPGLGPYDSSRFVHSWSQRHVAYICGLGNFGLNQMLITESGCAGRFGSLVIDQITAYTPIQTEPFCLHKINQTCAVCVEKCPSKALSLAGIDKAACSRWIDGITAQYFQDVRILRSCGKCIALPCAIKRPRAKGSVKN